MASGGPGQALPAAAGVAPARAEAGQAAARTVRPIGDGSLMHSVQALWTTARHRPSLSVAALDTGASAPCAPPAG